MLTTPTPNTEAAQFLRDKPPLHRSVFMELLPELRALAFTVTGVEDVKVLGRMRDLIAGLPLGEDYQKIKDGLIAELSPWLNDKAAKFRAELLLRLHGGQAYAAAQWRVIQRQKDVFPFLQYMSFGDERVRATHRALHGKIFPVDSPFWQKHYPPWEYLCRCQVIPLTEDDALSIRDADASLPPQERRFMEGSFLAKAENENLLFGKTLNDVHDLTPPSDREPDGYQWHPDNLLASVPDILRRLTPEEAAAFEAKARKAKLAGRTSLWDKLSGRKGPALVQPEDVEAITPEQKAAILKALGMTEKDLADYRAGRGAEWAEF